MEFDWREKAAELIRRVDHRNADRPVYILTAEEAADSFDLHENTLAIHHPLATYWLESVIERVIGRYDGPGFCCIVRKDQFPIHYLLEGVVGHEFIHFAQSTAAIEEFLLGCDNPDELKSPPAEPVIDDCRPDRTPWEFHGPEFHRLCVHFAYRAQVFDDWMGDANDLNFADYFLSRASTYGEVLGDEPQRLLDLPFAEITETEPPERFFKFAAEDLEWADERWQILKRSNPPARASEPELCASIR